MGTQHAEIINNLTTAIATHLRRRVGNDGLLRVNSSFLPGYDAGPAHHIAPIHCVGVHGNFRGSPYATCIARDGDVALTVQPNGVDLRILYVLTRHSYAPP
ncbi:hypothetical protein pmac_cds_551 [Pandoravirus macleodensis]|uniref:Uncharacterized protein n=1 Tax=Pandoravirus macleodensis TaxID=2107707 RepID=A0A2U7UFI1_9VIRU|nr:hypothetical protein pmac_cds_551 [Pandoravirus macleodensis]AVK77239.1 hypothetical protein pmac_cds_551 [Pandoravirus macleodensis]